MRGAQSVWSHGKDAAVDWMGPGDEAGPGVQTRLGQDAVQRFSRGSEDQASSGSGGNRWANGRREKV